LKAGAAPGLHRPALVLVAPARQRQAHLPGGSGGRSSRARDLGRAVATAWTLYESTLKDACVIDCTEEQATAKLIARLQMISLGCQKVGSPLILRLSLQLGLPRYS